MNKRSRLVVIVIMGFIVLPIIVVSFRCLQLFVRGDVYDEYVGQNTTQVAAKIGVPSSIVRFTITEQWTQDQRYVGHLAPWIKPGMTAKYEYRVSNLEGVSCLFVERQDMGICVWSWRGFSIEEIDRIGRQQRIDKANSKKKDDVP